METKNRTNYRFKENNKIFELIKMKKIYLISNDKIWGSKKKYTSNNDLNNLISCLNKDYIIDLICRKSKKNYKYPLNKKINFCKIDEISEKKINVFMISISPFNFFIFVNLMLRNFDLKGFVYLRSDGFLEYKIKYGIVGYYLYFIMFYLIKKKLKIISCSKNFNHVNTRNIVHPSELDESWLKKKKKQNRFQTNLLFVGRFKKEKGIINIIRIFRNIRKYKLTIVGTKKEMIDQKFYYENIKFIGPIVDPKKLIKIYDSSKIFILPSYTEGYPKVILEALSRMIPVIIFKDIKHVIHKRSGIFVSERNEKSLEKTIEFINKNYEMIKKRMMRNVLYTKNTFQVELIKIIKNEF